MTAPAPARDRAPVSESLEQRLAREGGPIEVLRHSSAGRFASPYPDQYTSWQEEQAAWKSSAVLFDQSHHMTDVYFRGPDVGRLLRDTGTNSFQGFGRDKAKHFVACAPSGNMIGSAVLFGLGDDEVSLVGPAAAANWLQFRVETEGYDVEISRDDRTRDRAGSARTTFRYEIAGPAADAILETVNQGPLDRVGFFRMTALRIAGRSVRALAHTMASLPGVESTGLELWGPAEDGPAIWDALREAGEPFGLVRGGMLAYYTGGVESGYAAQPTPAIYTGAELQSYREWLPGDGYEGNLSVGGSFASTDIEDYYVDPFDFGYGHLVKFDHDFIGRDALEARRDDPHLRKVWLRWRPEDVARVYASNLYGGERRAKFLDTPLGRYARVMRDIVHLDGEPIGYSTICGYTVNAGAWLSVGFVAADAAVDDLELTVLWGEEGGGTRKPHVESHRQMPVRATVHTTPWW
jgi:vanillate/3-O-methylgallate O-demethylase